MSWEHNSDWLHELNVGISMKKKDQHTKFTHITRYPTIKRRLPNFPIEIKDTNKKKTHVQSCYSANSVYCCQRVILYGRY